MMGEDVARLLLDPRRFPGDTTHEDNDGVMFRQNIRMFNNSVAFSSVVSKKHFASRGGGRPVNVLQGTIYSFIGPMEPVADREPAFLQLWLNGADGSACRLRDILNAIHPNSATSSHNHDRMTQIRRIMDVVFRVLHNNTLAQTFPRYPRTAAPMIACGS